MIRWYKKCIIYWTEIIYGLFSWSSKSKYVKTMADFLKEKLNGLYTSRDKRGKFCLFLLFGWV